MVIRRAGTSKPLLRSALRTRSRASCTWLPARPTMVSAGRPKATSTSTRTGRPSTPTIDALSVSASTRTTSPGEARDRGEAMAGRTPARLPNSGGDRLGRRLGERALSAR